MIEPRDYRLAACSTRKAASKKAQGVPLKGRFGSWTWSWFARRTCARHSADDYFLFLTMANRKMGLKNVQLPSNGQKVLQKKKKLRRFRKKHLLFLEKHLFFLEKNTPKKEKRQRRKKDPTKQALHDNNKRYFIYLGFTRLLAVV